MLNHIANDTTFYLAFGRSQKVRYLTDQPGETFFLDWFNDDEELDGRVSSAIAWR
jgi:hypothetical protein